MEKKSYYAIIPADVRYSEKLSANAKLLYGEITALCNEKGFCWANNQYFSELYQTTERTVSRWIRELSKENFIIIEDGMNQKRKICLDKNVLPPRQKCPGRLDKNVLYNNTVNNTVNKEEHSLEFLMNLPESVIKEFSDKFNCYETEIRGKAEDLYNYCLAHGRKYKNYKAFLRNAVKKDFGIRRKDPAKEWEKPQKNNEEGLKKLREIKDKFKIGKF